MQLISEILENVLESTFGILGKGLFWNRTTFTYCLCCVLTQVQWYNARTELLPTLTSDRGQPKSKRIRCLCIGFIIIQLSYATSLIEFSWSQKILYIKLLNYIEITITYMYFETCWFHRLFYLFNIYFWKSVVGSDNFHLLCVALLNLNETKSHWIFIVAVPDDLIWHWLNLTLIIMHLSIRISNTA